MAANVRAITIRQPYAWAIVKKGRRIENRTWITKSRGDLLIHAGAGTAMNNSSKRSSACVFQRILREAPSSRCAGLLTLLP